MTYKVGDIVTLEGQTFTVLGHAASVDSKGRELIEIAWGDLSASPTGYLAVSQDELVLRFRAAIEKRRLRS
jgi:hypothetical protein